MFDVDPGNATALAEHWTLSGGGHAFPAEGFGHNPFVAPAPVQAAEAMARFWGLAGR